MENFNRYLTISTLEEQWGLYVTTVGYTKIHSNTTYPDTSQHPNTHIFDWESGRILNGYYIVFISKGQGLFETEKNEPIRISEGCCFLLFPGIWHRYKPDPQTGWEEYWIGFKGFYAAELIKRFFDTGHPVYYTGLNENILRLYQAVMELVRTSQPGYHQEIAGITHQLLGILHTLAQVEQKNASRDDQLIFEAKFLLKETLREPETIENILKQLPVSYSKLRKDFKRITGQSPNQYQLDLRLNIVKELLTTTRLSMTEIAYQTGFDSASHLSKMFRKKFHSSPGVYRR